MDYLPGWDLIFVLRRFENHKLFGFIAALSAKIVVIEAIHKLRYIHRNIKPENKLLGLVAYSKMTDFVIAKSPCGNHDLVYYHQLIHQDTPMSMVLLAR
jgi:protein-serine/threonine kinase